MFPSPRLLGIGLLLSLICASLLGDERLGIGSAEAINCAETDGFNILLKANDEKLTFGGSAIRVTPSPRSGSGSLDYVDNGQGDVLPEPGIIQEQQACLTTGDSYTVQLLSAPGCTGPLPGARQFTVQKTEGQQKGEGEGNVVNFILSGCPAPGGGRAPTATPGSSGTAPTATATPETGAAATVTPNISPTAETGVTPAVQPATAVPTSTWWNLRRNPTRGSRDSLTEQPEPHGRHAGEHRRQPAARPAAARQTRRPIPAGHRPRPAVATRRLLGPVPGARQEQPVSLPAQTAPQLREAPRRVRAAQQRVRPRAMARPLALHETRGRPRPPEASPPCKSKTTAGRSLW